MRKFEQSGLIPGLIPGLVLILALIAGCGRGARNEGPPALNPGVDPCTACGMKVSDLHFAAVARAPGGATLAYDAIECLVRDLRTRRGEDAPTGIWLPDLATGMLHPAAEMTVVLANYPSPMGGGYAAFLDPETAADEARARNGVAGDLSAFVAGTVRRPGD